MQDYKQLVVWQKSHQAVLDIYSITKAFPKEERYSLTAQMRRASVSIPTNIAEGCGKFTARDFATFLQTSLGSTQEVEYLILLSRDLDYINESVYKKLSLQVGEVKAMLIALIKKVRQ